MVVLIRPAVAVMRALTGGLCAACADMPKVGCQVTMIHVLDRIFVQRRLQLGQWRNRANAYTQLCSSLFQSEFGGEDRAEGIDVARGSQFERDGEGVTRQWSFADRLGTVWGEAGGGGDGFT